MSEAIYDAEIAPKLAEIGRLCEKHGMAFVAGVEFEPGAIGATRLVKQGDHIGMRMASAALVSANVDVFFMWLTRTAAQEGHSSMYLTLLKVPERPAPAAEKGRGAK